MDMLFLTNMKIGRKLAVGFGSVALVLLCLGAVAGWVIQQLQLTEAGSEEQSTMMIAAQGVSEDLEGIGAHAANLALSSHANRQTLRK